MSSMDQAFVKAFARRNQSERTRTVGDRSGGKPPVSALVAGAADEPGSLQVDRSVAGTAKVWVDPIEDQIARADHPRVEVPKPHVETQVETAAPPSPAGNALVVDSMQHIHTAYATAFADPSMGSAEAASTVEIAGAAPPQHTATRSNVGVQDRVADPLPLGQRPAVEKVTELRVDPPAVHVRDSRSLAPFKAVWEVDVFDVPTPVADLFFEGTLFQQISERMSEAVRTGLNSLLVTSTTGGEGRSSVAIGLAMAAAASGIRVALVDADAEDPTLADDLRLDLQYGWVDTIRGGLPIKEVAVHAVEDGVTLIPLMPPNGRTAATAFEFVQMIDLLKNNFELVIIDGPTGKSTSIHQYASVVDSAIIVRDVTRTDVLAINEFSCRLRKSGVQGVGVVENYV